MGSESAFVTLWSSHLLDGFLHSGGVLYRPELFQTHSNRITDGGFHSKLKLHLATRSTSSFSLSPMQMSPCRAARP